MTGLDCLREEMRKRGLSSAQCESRTVAVVLDILAGSGDKYTKMWATENNESKQLDFLQKQVSFQQSQLRYFEDATQRQEKILAEMKEKKEHFEDYIDDFYKALEDCETAEGRDAIKTAQMFINSVKVDTKYDNTAFIIGLASILSRGGINAIKELQKINKRLPSYDETLFLN